MNSVRGITSLAFFCVVALPLMAGCGDSSASATGGQEVKSPHTITQSLQKPLVIGTISDEPAKDMGRLQPVCDYLVTKLNDDEYNVGRAAVRASMKQIADALRSGEIDIYLDSPFPTVIVQDLCESVPALRRWKKGVAEYHSVVFVRADSDLHELSDLEGKLIAFEEKFSTSSYQLPKASLLQSGLSVSMIERPGASFPAGSLAGTFSEDDDNTVLWVLRGKVNAGAVNNKYFEDLPDAERARLRIIHKTIDVPRQVVSFRPGLSKESMREIERVLVTMNEEPDGVELLKTFSKTTCFDRFPGGVESALEQTRKIVQLIREEL